MLRWFRRSKMRWIVELARLAAPVTIEERQSHVIIGIATKGDLQETSKIARERTPSSSAGLHYTIQIPWQRWSTSQKYCAY